MKKVLFLLAVCFCSQLLQAQVNQYTAKRIFATDSFRLVDIWLRKISTNILSTDSNSHNMIATNRAIMDAIRNVAGGGVTTANNGLSVTGNTVQLGQSQDDPSGSALITETRVIPVGFNSIIIRGSADDSIELHPTFFSIQGPFPTMLVASGDNNALIEAGSLTLNTNTSTFQATAQGTGGFNFSNFENNTGTNFSNGVLTIRGDTNQNNAPGALTVSDDAGLHADLIAGSAVGIVSFNEDEQDTVSITGVPGDGTIILRGDVTAGREVHLSVVGKGTFTDTLRATTMGDSDSSNVVATTEWVKQQGYSSSGSAGITSINSQTGPAITLAAGTSGTDFDIAQASNIITFNLPNASPTARGAINFSSQTFGGAKTFNDGIVATSTNTNARLAVSGDLAFPSHPGVGGTGAVFNPFTYTDQGAGRTETDLQTFHRIGQPTVNATNAVTYTDIATLKITGAPIAGTNMTITRPRALYAQGISHADILAHSINESSSATVSMGATGIYIFTGATATYTLPTLASFQGAVYYVKNAGSGDLTVQRAGSDNIYETSTVTSIIIPAGESRLIVAGIAAWYVL